MNPELEAISRARWQYFGSLTWKKVPCGRVMMCEWLRVVRMASRLCGSAFRRAEWVLRFEKGERTAREHLHFLLGGLGGVPCIATAFRIRAIWTGRVLKRADGSEWPERNGWATVTVWDPRLPGGAYITKGLDTAAQSYELSKFSPSSIELVLSDSFIRRQGWRSLRARPASVTLGKVPSPF